MKKIFLLLHVKSFKAVSAFLILMFIISCAARKPMTTSQWKDDLFKAGSNENEGFITIPGTNVMAKIYNNNEAFSIIIKITDDKIKPKLLLNGLIVYIDTTERKKENFAVVFPSAFEAMKTLGMPLTGVPMPGKSQKGFNISNLVQTINLAGVQLEQGDNVSLVNSNNAYISVDSLHFLNYIITMPFSILSNNNNYHGSVISIGIKSETTRPKAPDREKNEPEGMKGSMGGPPPEGGMLGSGMGGSMGGPPGGGMGRSRPEGNMSDNMSFSLKGWMVISLSFSPK